MRSSPGVSTLISLYITVAEVLVIFNDANARIKGVQILDHEIKQEILLVTPSFFFKSYNLLYQNSSDFKG